VGREIFDRWIYAFGQIRRGGDFARESENARNHNYIIIIDLDKHTGRESEREREREREDDALSAA